MAQVVKRKFRLDGARLSFPALFQRAKFNGEEGKFEGTFLVPKDSDAAKLLEAKLEEVRAEAFGKKKLPADKVAVKDGEFKSDLDGYAGQIYVKATSNKRPAVFDRDRTPLAEEDNRIYSGCYVNAIVTLWAQDNNYGKRINASLDAVQFVKDGEPFGSSGVSADEFDDLDDLGI